MRRARKPRAPKIGAAPQHLAGLCTVAVDGGECICMNVDGWVLDTKMARKKKDNRRLYKPFTRAAIENNLLHTHVYIAREVDKKRHVVSWRAVLRQPRTLKREAKDQVELPEPPRAAPVENVCVATLQQLWGDSIPELMGAGAVRFVQ